MKYDLSLRPLHFACLSGGKDSLYMFGLILSNLDKYPLDFVVHYELEIDWPWVKDVIDEMELRCKNLNIPFYRIKPSVSWFDLVEKYYFPTHFCRWCNSKYKLDCEKQVVKFIESLSCRPIAYIGFCADETSRFKYSISSDWSKGVFCYPLAEECINESVVLEWARKQPIFQSWYKYFNRQGCMLCPMISKKELAYMYKYFPDYFYTYFGYVHEWEQKFNKLYWAPYTSEEVYKRVTTKYVSILDWEQNQICIGDLYE